jgi:cation transport regulator ChaC
MSLQAEIARAEARLSDAEIQSMLATAVRLFVGRAQEYVEEHDSTLPAFGPDDATATDVMVTVTAMMKAVNLQVFELGMWQAWSGK